MHTFWSSIFTGNNGGAAVAAVAATEAETPEDPPSKRARTLTTPSLPAGQDLQYLQNLYWSAATLPGAAGGAPTVVPVVLVPLAAAATNSTVPSSSAMAFLLPTVAAMPDVTNLSSSSNMDITMISNNFNQNNIINDNINKRPRPQPQTTASASAARVQDVIQARLDQRKKRNAENARITRMRKRHAFSLMDLELKALQRENEWLKNIVKREIPPNEAQQIINDCCYSTGASGLSSRSIGFDVKDHHYFPLGVASDAAAGTATQAMTAATTGTTKPQEQLLGHSDFELLESLAKGKQAFVLSDPRKVDNPIVYASCAFLRLTGYTREQVIGRNCRFLQGIDTDPEQVTAIREAVESGKDGAACLINYKADGTPFWNHFFITALRDKKNRIVNYVGVQTEVDKPLDGIEPMMPAENNVAAAAATTPVPTTTTSSGSNPQESVASTVQEGSLTAKLAGFEKETIQRLNDKSANKIDMSKLIELEEEENNRKMPAVVASTVVPSNSVPMELFDDIEGVNMLDWSQLAEVLEADFEGSADFDNDEDPFDIGSVDDTADSQAKSCNTTEDIETNRLFEKSFFSFFTKAPRALVILTIRSEIVDSMTRNDGDVSDPGFLSALELLAKLYRERSLSQQQQQNDDIMHGQWREISRPTYQHGGMIGTNDRGEKVYTLGKMSFNMFKPGNLRVTVQSTINSIQPKADDKALPAAVPWSLRRELAQQGEQPSSSKLKSYGKQ
jgi:PAS domain S-box-containing protein